MFQWVGEGNRSVKLAESLAWEEGVTVAAAKGEMMFENAPHSFNSVATEALLNRISA